MVMYKTRKRSLGNDLQEIENTCDYRTPADIEIRSTPLVDDIRQKTGPIDVEEQNIIDESVSTEIQTSPSSLLGQQKRTKCVRKSGSTPRRKIKSLFHSRFVT